MGKYVYWLISLHLIFIHTSSMALGKAVKLVCWCTTWIQSVNYKINYKEIRYKYSWCPRGWILITSDFVFSSRSISTSKFPFIQWTSWHLLNGLAHNLIQWLMVSREWNTKWLWCTTDFSSRATNSLTFVVLSENAQLLDGVIHPIHVSLCNNFDDPFKILVCPILWFNNVIPFIQLYFVFSAN